MADIPRYQPTGSLYADVPRLDFAAPKEQVLGASSLGQSLDRVSEFAFKQAAKDKIAEGEQWAYNNPISKAQIEAAMRGEADIANQLPSKGTYFGDAARKVMAGQLRAELEMSARSELARISAQVDAGLIDNIGELDRTFAGISAAYGKVIAQADTEQANAFRAGFATTSSRVYLSAANKIGQMFNERMQTEATGLIGNTAVIVQKAIESTPDVVELKQVLNLEQSRVLGAASLVKDPKFYDDTRKQHAANVQQAYVSTLSDYAMSADFKQAYGFATDLDVWKAVSTGKMGKYSAVYATLDSATKDKIQTEVFKQIGNMGKLEREQEALLKEKQKGVAMEVRDLFYANKITADEFRSRIMPTGHATAEEIKASYEPQEVKSDPRLLYILTAQIDKYEIGEADIEKHAKARRISWSDANQLAKNLRNRSPEISAATQYIRNGFGNPESLMNNSKRDREISGQVVNQLLAEAEAAKLAGKPFNAMAVAQSLVAQRKSQDDFKAIEAAKKVFGDELGKSGLAYKEDYTEDELRRHPKGLSNDTIKRILRKQKAVTGDQ